MKDGKINPTAPEPERRIFGADRRCQILDLSLRLFIGLLTVNQGICLRRYLSPGPCTCRPECLRSFRCLISVEAPSDQDRKPYLHPGDSNGTPTSCHGDVSPSPWFLNERLNLHKDAHYHLHTQPNHVRRGGPVCQGGLRRDRLDGEDGLEDFQ